VRVRSDAQLAVEIAAEHKRSRGIYGSPRVHLELRARGVRVGRKRVERLMRTNGIKGRQKRRFRRTTDSRHAQPIAPNVLARNFDPKRPDETWAGDVTYVATGEGWLYLAVLLDLFSRRVVGWAISDTNDRVLALEALKQALRLRHPRRGLVHHSDRGSPYASDEYRAALAAAGVVASMSRTGDCWDAVAESFFATLRAELLDHARYGTQAEATMSIGDYIEGFYNPQRRHSHNGYVSPIEFELRAQIAPLAE
jgi:transposase InsO family protein